MSLDDKIEDAERILREAIEVHQGDREVVATCVLFSGGNDSTALLDLMVRLGVATHAVHVNTTIGIPATRAFVRERAAAHGLPLLERLPPVTYRELVLADGFPGPAKHWKMYQRLKERALRLVRKELVANGRKQRVVFIAGRRRSESARRSDIPEHEREDSIIWVSPLANWTKADLVEYRQRFNVPENPVSAALGMSGECLCGAFAEPGELERIHAHYPEVAEEIVAMERDLEARLATQRADQLWTAALAVGRLRQARLSGDRAATARAALEAARLRSMVRPSIRPEACQWGWGAYRGTETPSRSGPLCSSCDARSDPSKRILDAPSPELAAIVARRFSA